MRLDPSVFPGRTAIEVPESEGCGAMIINQKSLREQLYDFIREELTRGKLIPGAAINLNAISRELGISKTPLRDALLQLDTEGFVTISPRRGVFVNRLTLEDIRNCYEIIGALESTVILAVFDSLQPLHLEKMKLLNRELRASIKNEDFQSYYQQNILFHDVFLEMSHNQALKRIIAPMKRRLYDFPRRGYIKEWELGNCRDHDRLIEAFETGDRDAAIQVWRDVHWSFDAQEKYIRRFYFPEAVEPQDSKTARRPSPARRDKHPLPFQRRPPGRDGA
jgi:DNA-binding GntR family transcriptional regulator